MGVPAFFRWLSKKYPSIVVHCIEKKGQIVDGVEVKLDTSEQNPNDVEFDNLYLDMNGIIHPCCHPENKPAPQSEEEMMVAIFEYIDRIFNIVRPRRLLYMAIDGVAPRAKLNQQRSRRFRAAKEATEKTEMIARIREELEAKGVKLPPPKPKEEHFDSNCITPGTPFMDHLSKCLHYYIHDRQNNDPGWKNIEVILSDANVPGEGEHKIMDFIRRQRANLDHDANTRHCLCGADADLIMLGLASHETSFTIIREEFKPNQPRPCELCGQIGHEMKECTGAAKEKQGEFDELTKPIESETEFIFIRLNVLREYLAKELTFENLPFKFDLERVIDDWVFMCFFVGNDFLPHLPSLEIREGAIDRLVDIYKKTIYKTGGFVTDSGRVDLPSVQLIMNELGEAEDEIFKRRQESELYFRRRQKEQKRQRKMNRDDRPAWTPGGQFSPMPVTSSSAPVQNARQEAYQMRMVQKLTRQSGGTTENRTRFESMLRREDSPSNESRAAAGGAKRKREEESDSESEPEPEDDVKLWEDGWKNRYYEVKFKVDADDIAFRHKVAAAYVEGLCWVLAYYYQGCASWNWYFPYHFAPFASDFVNVGNIDIKWNIGKAFNPLEQLMAVFPAASKKHVPEPWGELMEDPESPIIDFYPTDFKVDLNGKKYAWQGVALLPFVDEKRLLKALEAVYPKITDAEKKRNIRGSDRLYIGKKHEGYDFLTSLYDIGASWKLELDMNPKLFAGMAGKVEVSEDVIKPGDVVQSPIRTLPNLPDNGVVCVNYLDPQYPAGFVFPAERLKSAVDPPPVLASGQKHIDSPSLYSRSKYQRRPQVGMAPYNKRVSVDAGGHRMLNHSLGGSYSNVAPPNRYGRQDRYSPRQHHQSDSSQRSGPYNSGRGGSPYGSHQSSYGGYGRQDGYSPRHHQPSSSWPAPYDSGRGGSPYGSSPSSYGSHPNIPPPGAYGRHDRPLPRQYQLDSHRRPGPYDSSRSRGSSQSSYGRR